MIPFGQKMGIFRVFACASIDAHLVQVIQDGEAS